MEKTPCIPASGLSKALKKRGLKAREVARMADITTAGAYLILNGSVLPRNETLRKLGFEIVLQPLYSEGNDRGIE